MRTLKTVMGVQHGKLVLITMLVLICIPDNTWSQDIDSNLAHRLTGQEIPRYHLVRSFFVHANGFYNFSDPQTKVYFLELLGIVPGTSAEAVLERAIARANEIDHGDDGPQLWTHESGEGRVVTGLGRQNTDAEPDAREYDSKLLAAELDKARQLGMIYRDLKNGLAEADVSLEGIESFIDQKVSPSTEMKSSEPFDSGHRVWVLSRAFEEVFHQD